VIAERPRRRPTIGAKATLDWHLDLSLAFVISFVVGSAVAALVGLPALRRRGFYLAVATLAFSLATTSYLLNKRYFGWVPDGRIARPPLFGRNDITSTASFYYVVYAVLAGSLFIVKGIRDSRTGRAFMALRDNERAAEAYGLHATRVRLVAFALSGRPPFGDRDANVHVESVADAIVHVESAVTIDDLGRPILGKVPLQRVQSAGHFPPQHQIVGVQNAEPAAVVPVPGTIAPVFAPVLEHKGVRARAAVDRVEIGLLGIHLA
jgi:hypothetical protein